MNWTDLQDCIAQRYCGTVLVLDDEIRRVSATGEQQLDPLFLHAKVKFEQSGMLCDLRHIDDDFEDASKVQMLLRQIRRSDTVMLDWYLGAGKDAQKDPVNSLRVLNELSRMGGFRFAVIQSKEDSATIVAKLMNEFRESFVTMPIGAAPISADDDAVTVISEENEAPPTAEKSVRSELPSTYRLKNSLYVTVITKDRSSTNTADIPFFFVSGLKAAYPDHLHWVGFDFSARVRELLPNVLEVLPKGTDSALVFQALVQGDGELGDCLVENLADEIRELLRANPLNSASDKMLIGRISGDADASLPDKMKAACRSYIHSEKRKTEFITHFGSVECIEGQSIKKAAQTTLSKFIAKRLYPNQNTLNHGAAHNGFASLREHYRSQAPERLYPGVVLKSEVTSQSAPEWLVCMSPSCDCARGDNARDYLFVGGSSVVTPESDGINTVQTCIELEGAYVQVKWSGKRFKTITSVPSKVDGYRFHTRLRDDFVQLLIQRVFGWQSRVGVNTSEYLRITREIQ